MRKGNETICGQGSRRQYPGVSEGHQGVPGYYEAYAKLGAAELDLEQWGEAEAAFRKAIDLSGGHYAPADFGLGLILATVTKHFADAEAIVRAGLETSPANVTGHFVLAWVLYSTARLQEAEENVRQAISANPNGAARLLLAQIHLQQRLISQQWWTTSMPIWPWALSVRWTIKSGKSAPRRCRRLGKSGRSSPDQRGESVAR